MNMATIILGFIAFLLVVAFTIMIIIVALRKPPTIVVTPTTITPLTYRS